MSTAVTHDIRITVTSRFEPAHSDTPAGRYLFSYGITITNRGSGAVRLLRRHWIIRDSLAPVREVEGPGVVGETPVIEPGASYSYSSACDLRSGHGSMEGTYLMEWIADGQQFRATIPSMYLNHPGSLN